MDLADNLCGHAPYPQMTLVHFCVHGLDLLGKLDALPEKDKAAVREWIYTQQVLPDSSNPESWRRCGFRDGPSVNVPLQFSNLEDPSQVLGGYAVNQGHLAMTYTAIASLAALGDDGRGINKQAIICAVGALQQEDGGTEWLELCIAEILQRGDRQESSHTGRLALIWRLTNLMLLFESIVSLLFWYLLSNTSTLIWY
ncbi:unnamed protein product [Choristocarpus tenellus]